MPENIEDIINNPSPEPPEDKETEDLEPEDEIKEESEAKDDGPGVVATIMKKLGLSKSEADDESGEAGDETESEDIPDEFTEAALKNGWTEDDIMSFASDYSDDELKEMIPFLSDTEPESEKAQEKKSAENKQPPEKKSESEKDESEAIKELRKEIADLKKGQQKNDAAQEEKAQVVLMETVNKAFDEAAEKFEIFGKTDELPKFPAGPRKGQWIPSSPAMKARNEVWDIANQLINSGVSAKDAMDNALIWYKGKHLDKDVERKFIKSLKKGEKKLSAKRQGKETQKTYENEEDRGAAVVKELARKAGVKGELDD